VASTKPGLSLLCLVGLAAFAPANLLLFGCDSHGCDSFRASDFSTAMELTEADLLELREEHGLAADEAIPCAAACQYAHDHDIGGEVVEIESCRLQLVGDSDRGPDDVAATVECSGQDEVHACG
jgi:hypothetical protein